jgi:hypothetical protein
MSFSAVVDSRYRLTAADLEGKARVLMVTRVSYQGVENLQPLLHFEGVNKPLALDAEQRATIIRLARSSATSDWVGVLVKLWPIYANGRQRIVLSGHEERQPSSSVRSLAQAEMAPRSFSYTPPAFPSAAPPPAFDPNAPSPTAPLPAMLKPVGLEKLIKVVEDLPPTTGETQPAQPSKASRQGLFTWEELPEVSIWTPVLLGLLLLALVAAMIWPQLLGSGWDWMLGLFAA